MKKIYLDNNATTLVDPRVIAAMCDELSLSPSNPSSTHSFGQAAKKRLQNAREKIAAFFKCKPSEVIFTSGATEAINMLLRGIKARHIISSDIEHSAVYNTLKNFESDVTFLSAGHKGYIDSQDLVQAIQASTNLLVFGAANSETGVKNDIEAFSDIALSANIPLIVDGVALLGKEPFRVPEGVSAIAFSGHKFHAPQGIGFAIIRSGFKISPFMTGGDQEYSKRSGTENLPGIIGLAKAIEILSLELLETSEKMKFLRDDFENQLKKHIAIQINGEGQRISNTSNIFFPNTEGETLLIQLDRLGIAASHGSACSSGALEPSRILTNMGFVKERVRSSLRFSLSRFTTQDEVNQAVKSILKIVNKKI